jgi:hypothetical protein
MTGDVGLAEDLAHDALVTALEKWPESACRRTRPSEQSPRDAIPTPSPNTTRAVHPGFHPDPGTRVPCSRRGRDVLRLRQAWLRPPGISPLARASLTTRALAKWATNLSASEDNRITVTSPNGVEYTSGPCNTGAGQDGKTHAVTLAGIQ